MTELLHVVLWLLAIEVFWLAALPLTLLLFRPLADHGAPFAHVVGLVVVGYALWLLGNFGILRFSPGAAGVALAALAFFAWGLDAERRDRAWAVLRRPNRLVVAGHLMFLVGYFGMTWYRAYNPEIVSTEKPMDFLFLNSLARGDLLPPEDPWLAGYSISYYYFGYLLFAMVSKLTATPTNISFNLALGTLYGMLMAGSFSLAANLVVWGHGRIANSADLGRSQLSTGLLYGLLGAVLTGVAANLVGVLEFMKRQGWATAGLLQFFAVHDLDLDPGKDGGWWWWRSTRVISDINPATGARAETINEFPFFSYLLGDLHPHVMAGPFFVACAALGLAMVCRNEPIGWQWARRHPIEAALGVLLVGALGFINTWDLPTGALLLGAAHLLVGLRHGEGWVALVKAAVFGLMLFLAGFALYAPFWLGFRTQNIGIGLVSVRTRLPQFALFWGFFYFAALSFAATAAWRIAGLAGAGLLGWRHYLPLWFAAGLALVAQVFGAAVLAWLLLLLGLIFTAALLRPTLEPAADQVEGSAGWRFGLGLAGAGVLLIALCEVVFANDVFGNRMNTIFKLFYQAWPLLAAVAAFAAWYTPRALLNGGIPALRPIAAGTWLAAFGLLVAGALLYPAMAQWTKANGYRDQPTLDGMRWLSNFHPADANALRWLRREITGQPVILEAFRPTAYDYPGRVSAYTGLPSLLGWENHENQWRGNHPAFGRRKPDIEAIYRQTDPGSLASLIERYGIRYIYYGDLERQLYGDLDAVRRQRFVELTGGVAYDVDGVVIFGPNPRLTAVTTTQR